MARPELKMTRHISTPLRDQVYVCSECGKEFRANVAPFGNRATRALVQNMTHRFAKHAEKAHA